MGGELAVGSPAALTLLLIALPIATGERGEEVEGEEGGVEREEVEEEVEEEEAAAARAAAE